MIFEGKHHSIASLPGMFERTITVNGFSKTYAMTGWRVGWSVAPLHITKELNKLQSQSVTNVTSFVQMAGVEALKGPQDFVQMMKVELKAAPGPGLRPGVGDTQPALPQAEGRLLHVPVL